MTNFNINDITDEINLCDDLQKLTVVNNKYFSRENGLITNALKAMGKITNPEEKKALAMNLNQLKSTLTELIAKKENLIKDLEIERKINNEKIDVTASANNIIYNSVGSFHPITKTTNDLKKILNHEGFAIIDGYNIETSYYNFGAVNTGVLHPARQSQDTIYIDKNTIFDDIKNSEHFASGDDDEFLLRTHTSAQQIRIAKNIIAKLKEEGVSEDDYKFKYATFGETYRNESDGTHSPMFHQVEVVCISRNLYVQDLIDVILLMLSKFFNISPQELKIKLRSSYFPFTVPSWEVDLFLESKNSFVEILGCGMVHPTVIENMGLNSKLYRGYALGAGIERLCMLKNNIGDLRRFFGADVEWLKAV